jgi:hypothetical protein
VEVNEWPLRRFRHAGTRVRRRRLPGHLRDNQRFEPFFAGVNLSSSFVTMTASTLAA